MAEKRAPLRNEPPKRRQTRSEAIQEGFDAAARGDVVDSKEILRWARALGTPDEFPMPDPKNSRL